MGYPGAIKCIIGLQAGVIKWNHQITERYGPTPEMQWAL